MPRLLPLIAFDNNTVHAVAGNGFHCDDGQNADQTIQATIHWSPSTGPYNTTKNGYPVIAVFNDFRAWKVRDHGACTYIEIRLSSWLILHVQGCVALLLGGIATSLCAYTRLP